MPLASCICNNEHSSRGSDADNGIVVRLNVRLDLPYRAQGAARCASCGPGSLEHDDRIWLEPEEGAAAETIGRCVVGVASYRAWSGIVVARCTFRCPGQGRTEGSEERGGNGDCMEKAVKVARQRHGREAKRTSGRGLVSRSHCGRRARRVSGSRQLRLKEARSTSGSRCTGSECVVRSAIALHTRVSVVRSRYRQSAAMAMSSTIRLPPNRLSAHCRGKRPRYSTTAAVLCRNRTTQSVVHSRHCALHRT